MVLTAIPGHESAQEEELQLALHRSFGFADFLPFQRRVIAEVLAGRDVLAVMPTGAGKSLCFQLPALVRPGLALVVSPLIALMKDQVDQLLSRNISAGCLNSAVPESERRRVTDQLRSGALKILYVAPERLRARGFLEMLGRTPVGILAVDEAHCISEWGHDFRPDYTRLGDLRHQLGSATTLALTATATPRVRADILESMGMAHAQVIVAGFDRPGLFLEVRRVRSRKQKVDAIAEMAPQGPGLVYAATRKQAELLALNLRSRRIAAEVYHAGLDAPSRARIQDGFMSGGLPLVVATNAFGMGIDKPDIRFVVHAQIPRSIEAYYQEIGRAGRDHQPARALLLFNHADVFLQERLLTLSFPPAAVIRDLWEAIRFEPLVRTPVSRLAARLGTSEERVHAALKLLERAGHLDRGVPADGPAVIEVRDFLASSGGQSGRVLGVLRDRLGDAGPQAVFLEELLGEAGLPLPSLRRVLHQLHQRELIHFCPPLRDRAIAVQEMGLPVDQLRVDLPAVDRRSRHVQALLKSISRYAYSRACLRHFILEYFGDAGGRRCMACSNCAPAQGRRPAVKGLVESSAETTHALFQSGFTVHEVAQLRGLAPSTIYSHLEMCARQGMAVALDRVLPAEAQVQVREILSRSPATRLTDLQREVAPIGFDQLRVMLACLAYSEPSGAGEPEISPPTPGSAPPAATGS